MQTFYCSIIRVETLDTNETLLDLFTTLNEKLGYFYICSTRWTKLKRNRMFRMLSNECFLQTEKRENSFGKTFLNFFEMSLKYSLICFRIKREPREFRAEFVQA